MKGPLLSGDTVPEVVGLYVPPRPLPEVSQHRTLDLKSIRISDHADPRRALTERRLVAPPPAAERRVFPWLAALAGIGALAVAAWFLVYEPSAPAPSELSPAPRATPSSAGAPKPAAPRVTTAAPLPSAAAGTPTSTAATPAAEPPAYELQKAPRPRESTKKRKDPWLE